MRRLTAELVVVSFVVLFQELALIRWLPVEVRVIGSFPSLILLSAFLGLRVGAFRARAKSIMWMWPAFSFVPLGQFVGVRLEAFRTRSSALW